MSNAIWILWEISRNIRKQLLFYDLIANKITCFWSSREKQFLFIIENLCFKFSAALLETFHALKLLHYQEKIATGFSVHKHVSISKVLDSLQPNLKLKFRISSFFLFFSLIYFLSSRLLIVWIIFVSLVLLLRAVSGKTQSN